MKILIYKIKKIIIKRFKNIYFEIKVWFISRQIIKSGKTFLFIDCGSNLGQGFKFFRKYFTLDIFDYILIEPNPNCIKELKKLTNKKITLIQKGVWSSEGSVKFYGISETNNKYSSGGSFLQNHNSLWYKTNKENYHELNTISLSKLLKEKKDNYDVIILKMDIESSEYEVLPSIIKDKSIDLIDHIFIEFHGKYFKIKDQLKYQKIEQELKKIIKSRGVGFTNWR